MSVCWEALQQWQHTCHSEGRHRQGSSVAVDPDDGDGSGPDERAVQPRMRRPCEAASYEAFTAPTARPSAPPIMPRPRARTPLSTRAAISTPGRVVQPGLSRDTGAGGLAHGAGVFGAHVVSGLDERFGAVEGDRLIADCHLPFGRNRGVQVVNVRLCDRHGAPLISLGSNAREMRSPPPSAGFRARRKTGVNRCSCSPYPHLRWITLCMTAAMRC